MYDLRTGKFLPFFDLWKSRSPKGMPEPQEYCPWWPDTQGKEWTYSFAEKYSGISDPADCYAVLSFVFVDDGFETAWYPNDQNSRAELTIKFFSPQHSIDTPLFTQTIGVKLTRRFTEEYWLENKHRFFAEGGGMPQFNPPTYPITKTYICPDCEKPRKILYIHKSLIGHQFKCHDCCYPQVPRQRGDIERYFRDKQAELEQQELELKAIADEREARRRAEFVYRMILEYKLANANILTTLENFDKGSTIIQMDTILDLSVGELPALLRQAVQGAISYESISRLNSFDTTIKTMTTPTLIKEGPPWHYQKSS